MCIHVAMHSRETVGQILYVLVMTELCPTGTLSVLCGPKNLYYQRSTCRGSYIECASVVSLDERCCFVIVLWMNVSGGCVRGAVVRALAYCLPVLFDWNIDIHWHKRGHRSSMGFLLRGWSRTFEKGVWWSSRVHRYFLSVKGGRTPPGSVPASDYIVPLRPRGRIGLPHRFDLYKKCKDWHVLTMEMGHYR